MSYMMPIDCGPTVLEHRKEANRRYEALLRADERKYWQARVATTPEEAAEIRDELSKLDELDATSHG